MWTKGGTGGEDKKKEREGERGRERGREGEKERNKAAVRGVQYDWGVKYELSRVEESKRKVKVNREGVNLRCENIG